MKGKGGEGFFLALGLFSVGLGLAQMLAPGMIANWIGVADDQSRAKMMRACGMRELATGAGLLMQPHNKTWLMARVGGDAMDIALLGAALNSGNAEQEKVAITLAAVLGITVADVMATQQLNAQNQEMRHSMNGGMNDNMDDGMNGGQSAAMRFQQEDMRPGPGIIPMPQAQAIFVQKSITIRRPAHELYQFWRNFENLPQLMRHLENVEVKEDGTSHWTAKAPAGMHVSWDAEIVEDQPDQMISWRSLSGATIQNSGWVRFVPAPGDRGTEVHVELQYNPPGGQLGALIAKLFGEEPAQQIYDDLRRFKQLMETGNITQSDATFGGDNQRPHPGQPSNKPAMQQQERQALAGR